MFRLTIFITLLFTATMSIAQPSDAEVKKQMMGNGVLEVKLDGKGIRQWNSDLNNYEYARNVKIIRNSEYPGIKLSINGDAVYQYMGNGSYKYWKYRVIDNSYIGVPNPNTKEIFDLLSSDWPRYYESLYNSIVKLHVAPALDANPGWVWHTINSVEFRTHLKYDKIISNTEVETIDEVRSVRLYRDDVKQPWKTFLPNTSAMGEEKSLGIKTYSAAEIKEMEKQTLEFTLGGQMAKEQPVTTGQTSVIQSPNNWPKGAKVMVEEDGKWYPSTVLDTRPGEWYIHYDGYDSKYDLWVGPSRIKNK